MTTVQDLGRFGHAAVGVPQSGGADWLSLRIGNRLLGNDDKDAVLEMTLVGGRFVFEESSLICLAGADMPSAMVYGGGREYPVERWRPVVVVAGDELRIGPLRGGARSYICVAGGVRTPPVLGSRSTLVSCGLGGVGRALRAGDQLEIGIYEPGRVVCALGEEEAERAGAVIGRRTLRIVPGAQLVYGPPLETG
ncbi:MAG: biotin-dependent carboxyltransferase family protein, partial [Phycisphaerales bacterium]